LAILELQDRCENYYLQKFTNKNDEQISTFLSFKISPILPNNFCHPEKHNLTEVWTQLKNGVITTHFKEFIGSSGYRKMLTLSWSGCVHRADSNCRPTFFSLERLLNKFQV